MSAKIILKLLQDLSKSVESPHKHKNMENEISYSGLKCREVVNSVDGRRLGRIADVVFSCDTGIIKGIVLPYPKRGMFGKMQDLFIPWQCVKMLGSDVIIVEICDFPFDDRSTDRRVVCKPNEPPHNHCPPPPPPPCPPNPPPCPPNPPPRSFCDNAADVPEARRAKKRGCDGKCEKCMLFDCASRWEDI